jgi:hypothetical protein
VAVEVDADFGLGQSAVERRQRSSRNELVHRTAEPCERLEPGGRREDATMLGECLGERTQRRNGREQIAHSERAEDDETRTAAYGQDDSVDGATTNSRTSHPEGWRRTNTTAAATSSGRFSCASGGGR